MIIYNKELALNLLDYGIEVPLLDDRASKTFDSLGGLKETPMSEIIPLTKEDLLLVHSSEFVNSLFSNDLKESLLKCYELVDSEGNFNRYNPGHAKSQITNLFDTILLQAGATNLGVKKALDKGFAFTLAGGMHHAMTSMPRGFCLINDLVIAARKFQKTRPGATVAIVDIDVHKGCGSAEITENDSSIETLSIHMSDGWPLDLESGEGPWRIPSTIDIPISKGEEGFYLKKLQEGLEKLSQCDLVIIAGGADPYVEDVLESSNGINLNKEEMLERDLLVYKFFKEKKVPQVWTLAGGYGPKTWEVYYNFLRSIREEESF